VAAGAIGFHHFEVGTGFEGRGFLRQLVNDGHGARRDDAECDDRDQGKESLLLHKGLSLRPR
jgi:hypothetical protein